MKRPPQAQETEQCEDQRHEEAIQELDAMRACWDVMEALSPARRSRVLAWLDAQIMSQAH